VNLLSKAVHGYMERHTNPWNRALHLVGVPIAPILCVVFLVLEQWLAAAVAFVVGYTLQWLGHRIEGDSMWDTFEGKVVKALAAPFRLLRSRP